MVEQERQEGGKFAAKGFASREVRSIRLTDKTWHLLGDRADENDMSKADFLEGLFSGEIDWQSEDLESDKNDLDFDPQEVAEILKNVLNSKKRGNKHFKAVIREVLEVMGEEVEDE
jgi:hypothetical protein